MFQDPLVSVIIPVFNAAATLKRCLQSVLSQSYLNIELLVIDDGSTDGSSSIAAQMFQTDSRGKIFSQTNAGPSAARNNGIKNARGEYIMFVDADDWIENDAVEVLVRFANYHNAKLVSLNFQAESTEGLIPRNEFLRGEYPIVESYDRSKALNCLFLGEIGFFGWSFFYRASVFSSAGIRFDEEISVMEDALLINNLIRSIDRLYFFGERPLYHYYIDPKSITHNANELSIESGLLAVSLICKMDDNANNPFFSRWEYDALFFVYNSALSLTTDNQGEMSKMVVRFFRKEISRHGVRRLGVKSLIKCLLVEFNIYHWIFFLKNR